VSKLPTTTHAELFEKVDDYAKKGLRGNERGREVVLRLKGFPASYYVAVNS